MSILGQGTTLAYYNSSYVAIGEVTDFSGPNISRDTIETTTLDQSTNHRTYVGGLIDSGEITFEVQFDPSDTDMTYIQGLLDSSATASSTETLETLKLTFTDSGPTSYYANGIFTGLSVSVPKDDLVTASVTFKVSGGFTETDPNA